MGFNVFDSSGKRQIVNSIANMPIGSMISIAFSTVPAGWLKCDGTAVSRTAYAELFSAIGTSYGTGDGSTTFNLPYASGQIIYALPVAKAGSNLLPAVSDGSITSAKLDSATLNPLNTKSVIQVRDEKSSGTNGGTFSSGSWQTRTLNTSKTNTITNASLSSNQISLPSGTYWAQAMASAYRVQAHQAKLYNVTGSTDLILGMTAYSIDTAGVGVSNVSLVTGSFTLSGTSSIELQHRCGGSSGTSTGYGIAGGFSTEVYSDVIIWKVA